MTPVALEPAVLAPSISVMTTVPDTAPSDADTAGSVIQDLLKVPPGNPLAGLVLESVTLSDGTVSIGNVAVIENRADETGRAALGGAGSQARISVSHFKPAAHLRCVTSLESSKMQIR